MMYISLDQLAQNDTAITQSNVSPSLFATIFATELMLLAVRAVALLLLALIAVAVLAAIPTIGMYCCRFLRFANLRKQWQTPLPHLSSMRAKFGLGEFEIKNMYDKVRMNSKIDTRRSKQLNLLQDEVLELASRHSRLLRGTTMIGAMMVDIAGRLDQLEELGASERRTQRRSLHKPGRTQRSKPDPTLAGDADLNRESRFFGAETDWPLGDISEDEIIDRRRYWFGIEAEIEGIREEYYLRSLEAGENPEDFIATYGEPRKIDIDAQVEQARREFRAIREGKAGAMGDPDMCSTFDA